MENEEFLNLNIDVRTYRCLSGVIVENPYNIGDVFVFGDYSYKVESIEHIEIHILNKNSLFRISKGYDTIRDKKSIDKFFEMVGYPDKNDFLLHRMRGCHVKNGWIYKYFYLLNFDKLHPVLRFT